MSALSGKSRETAYRPVLFLGLGGTGKEVLLRLRLRLYERFRTFNVPFARFLWIDTDTRATDARGQDLSSALASVSFDEHEKFALLRGNVGKDMHDIFENPGQWPHVHEWLYPDVRSFGSEIADGAGGVRAVGRLTLFAKYSQLRAEIETKLQQLARLETIGETQDFFAEHLLPQVRTDGSTAPAVFVVTSLAGGTGCGTFLDVGFMLRDIKRYASNVGDLFAYALLPNVYNASPQGEVALRSYANAYAALKELDHYTKRLPGAESMDAKEGNPSSDFLVSWERNKPKRVMGPPFSATYLLEITNEANLPMSQENRSDLFSMLAEALFLDILPGAFSDAKRSDYSNVVEKLSGRVGANTEAKHVHFNQAFARRYASCGMSKIEIPLDTVRGACASRLAASIFDFIRREREDTDVGRAVPRDLAAAQLDRAGIYNSFGSEWKGIITDGVSGIINGAPLKTSADVAALSAELDRIENELVLSESDRIGTSIRWVRQRTGTVIAETKGRFSDLLRDRVLENPERGLATALRKGYFDLAISRTKDLIDPSSAGSLGEFDALIAETDSDVLALRGIRTDAVRELHAAVRSVPALLLGARQQIVKLALDRLRDAQEQYLFAAAERQLLVETRKVAQELYRTMRESRDALSIFLDKAETIRGAAEQRFANFKSRLANSSHVLFIQLFDMDNDWPKFYKLDVDPETAHPADVNPAREYVNLLRHFESAEGLAGLANLLRRETTQEVDRRVEEFCERRFYEDFIKYPRQVSVLDHPMLKDPAQMRQTLQNFVNQARPMLRRDTRMAATEVETTAVGYLGISNPGSPESRDFIDQVQQLARVKVETHDNGRPYEIYLYFSSFAFPLPSVSLVQNECHLAYTDFYSQFSPGQARQAVTGIPLHLSKRWEGRFDDLVIYSDEQAELLEEVLSILRFAPLLNILTTALDKATGMMNFYYKDAPPYTTTNLLGKRRNVIGRLMADSSLREILIGELHTREDSLTPAQLKSYFWALQAELHNADIERDTPDYQLIFNKVGEIHARILKQSAGTLGEIDADLMPETGKLDWIRGKGFGLDWPAEGQPVVAELPLWRKPVRQA
ncbi:MAG TPA: tubulin-like doman-containing protein [Acidisarcina sp.]